MNTLFTSSVPDPSDFPASVIAPGLRTLDAAIRCTICGELFDAPVTLLCGHCFCSFCVRTAMAEKQECPGCRKMAMEGHLRPNPVMEEVVAAWKLSRPYLLKLSKEDEQERHWRSVGTPKAKKRKLTTAETSKASRDGGTPRSQLKPKNARRTPDGSIPTSDSDSDTMPTFREMDSNPRPDDLVPCPICNKGIRYEYINQHMDKGCPDPRESTKSDWNKIMNSAKKRKQNDTSDCEDNFPLPKASYATLKDKQLKDILLENNLPITGDRNLWIQRHQRWVMIYNANLDRSQIYRKTKGELRKELKKWEVEKSKKRKSTVEDVLAHEKRHKDEFSRLTDAARGSKRPSSKRTVGMEGRDRDSIPDGIIQGGEGVIMID